ncbi:MAG TPA: glycosyltransferase [Chloroflexota bacterium]|nr:glycosyltransferase [Chloroflexota bacterium]
MWRIAMISEHASPIANMGSADCGGQNIYVDQVSRELARLGHQVDVYTRADRPGLAPRAWGDGVRIIPVAAGPLAPVPKDEIWQHIDAFVAETDRLGRIYGPYALIHGNFWMSGWAGGHLKTSWGAPFVQIFHALGIIKQIHQGEADTSPPDRLAAERFVLSTADRVIAQCPSEVDELVQYYDADASRIRVVPSGVDLTRFFPIPRAEARSELGLASDEKILVYVGRLQPRKDVANLIYALAAVRNRDLGHLAFEEVRLLVVGGETADADLAREPEMRRLAGIAEELGIRERVTFVGRRPSDRLRWYYSAADVFVTTPWYEPYGLTPLEAMACGTPAVCSAVGGITFTVADGETGYLVPPRAPDALAERLASILTEEEVRGRFARNARRRVEEQFTWKAVAAKTAKVYGEVLGTYAQSARQS